ncbi:glycoside hydrolase [Granulicella sp. 5B5]|uniref:glycoside hydrolase family 28 protein n=1 Tax=Granulicella sp. 5B5 TaxID=1617967 RepID=UPI00176E9BCD|nr:glycosyl hydrolase family 28 protein [Granulicella sp. 5B5]QMV17363.1 glycoside hydrolase [Granulicella sp. 5B5]
MKLLATIAVFGMAAVTFAAEGLAAQDMRRVTEPVVPPVCQTLKAELMAPGGIAAVDEQRLDTARLQKGLDGCAPGHALELASDGEHNAFLSGPIELRTGVTLLVDKGVTLYGSRDPKVYEKSPGSCGVVNDEKAGCRTLIVADHADDAGIMGDGVIDGRGGAKLLVDGKDSSKTWWDLAEDARGHNGQKDRRQQVPRLIEMNASNNFTIYRITLKNSANFHVVYHHGDGFTVWGLKIDTPRKARNTDGVDPSASKNITITHSYIRDGDDNIAIKGGDGPVTNMTVSHNHFYWGHGMSIGSETNAGVSAIRVTDLSLDGDDDAIRIKSNPSRGGLVHDVVYDDVCIRNSKAPVFLDTNYNYPGKATNLFPVYEEITLRNVRIAGGGRFQLNGYDHTHRIGVRFDGVELEDPPGDYKFVVNHTDVTLGPGPVNFPLSGTDSTVSGKAGKGKLAGCAAMFVAFPGEAGNRE